MKERRAKGESQEFQTSPEVVTLESQQLLAPHRYLPVAAESQQLLTKKPQPAAMREAAARHVHREHHHSTNQARFPAETLGRGICEGAWRQKATKTIGWTAVQT